jgi:tRNA 5-methylaminomethyl-2-thiouridine biosynthesis bifunctional protein
LDATAHDALATLATCGWPNRWASTPRCVVLETDFKQGHGVLALMHAWAGREAQPDAGRGESELVIISIAGQPPAAQMLESVHAVNPWRVLATRLAACWPPLTPDLHLLTPGPGLHLLLAVGEGKAWLRSLRLRADLLLVDMDEGVPGHAMASKQAAWDLHAMKSLARLAAPGAALVARGHHRGWQPHARAAGFAAAFSAGPTPASVPPSPPSSALVRPLWLSHLDRSFGAPAQTAAAERGQHALVIGAGIAGACTAAALARRGWTCSVLDSHAAPAGGASGNPAALFHGAVHAGDGLHARFTRACALHATQLYRGLINGGVAGRSDGLLRAHAVAVDEPWPADWVQRLDSSGVQQRLPGLRADSAWFYPGGGWIDAAAAVHALLASPRIRFVGAAAVASLRRSGADWQAVDHQGIVLGSAPVVVIANATGRLALRDAGEPDLPDQMPPVNTQRSRGQVTWFNSDARLPYPVAGGGYAVSWQPGRVLCGATTEPVGNSEAEDSDTSPRDADHRFNLQRLLALTGIQAADGALLQGRVGWRHSTADRLPLVGAVPQALQPADRRLERLRDLQRVPGVFALAGLGGRGFSWAPLAGEMLAAMIDDGPLPLESALLDAVDPGRGLLRQLRVDRVARAAAR